MMDGDKERRQDLALKRFNRSLEKLGSKGKKIQRTQKILGSLKAKYPHIYMDICELLASGKKVTKKEIEHLQQVYRKKGDGDVRKSDRRSAKSDGQNRKETSKVSTSFGFKASGRSRIDYRPKEA